MPSFDVAQSGRLRRSELCGVRLQARVLAACAIHCNYCTLLAFTQITVIILRLDVLISNRCYLNTKLLVTQRIQLGRGILELFGEFFYFVFSFKTPARLHLARLQWNKGGWS